MNLSHTTLNTGVLYKNLTPDIQKKINEFFTPNCSYAIPFSGEDYMIMRESTNVQLNPVCIYCIKRINNYEVSLYTCCKYNYKDKSFPEIYKIIQSLDPNITVINYVAHRYTQIGKAENNTYMRKYENISAKHHTNLENFYKANSTCEDFGIKPFKPEKMGDFGYLFFTKDNIGKIVAASYVKYNNIQKIGEMYSSCTKEASRGKGIMKINVQNLLTYLQQIHPDLKRIWAGLDVNHPKFIGEANRKAKTGFGWTLSIDTVTPLGFQPPFRFLSMWWEPSIIITQDMLNNVKAKIDLLKTTYDLSVFISSNQINELNTIRDNNPTKEVAGKFKLNPLNHNLIQDGLVTTIPIQPPSVSGTTCFTGLFGQSTILSFHTHPNGCYNDEKVNVGWPSHYDWLWVFNTCFNANAYRTVQIVIAFEGIYSIRLSSSIADLFKTNQMGIINNISSHKSIIDANITTLIMGTYHNRKQPTEYMQNQAIQDYLSLVNNFIISPNLPLFHVSYISKAAQAGGMSFLMY